MTEADWEDALKPEDRRRITLLFLTHVASYGEVRLDMVTGCRRAPEPRLLRRCDIGRGIGLVRHGEVHNPEGIVGRAG